MLTVLIFQSHFYELTYQHTLDLANCKIKATHHPHKMNVKNYFNDIDGAASALQDKELRLSFYYVGICLI